METMKLKQYLNESTTVRFSKPKEHKSKEISVKGKEIAISTEVPSPTAVSGVRNSISRKKFKDEDEAKIAFEKMLERSRKQGWMER